MDTEHALELTASDCEPILTISKDGELWINPKYSTDEAAQKFWDAVKKFAKPAEPRT